MNVYVEAMEARYVLDILLKRDTKLVDMDPPLILVCIMYVILLILENLLSSNQDTRLCVSGQKDMRHTNELFTGTAKSQFSTPHISITTGPNLHISFPPYIHDFTYQI